MRKSSYQFATDAEISYLLEKALNAGPEDTDNVKIARYVLSEASSVRAITYRILRKASQVPDDLLILLKMHMDCFALRSLELEINNCNERIEALKLCTMMLNHMTDKARSSGNVLTKANFPSINFPENVCRALISIASLSSAIRLDRPKVDEKEDELAFPCLAVIVEQAGIAPDLILSFIETGWIVELFTSALFSDRLSTSVCRILCAWLDLPQLRIQAKLRLVLDRIFASVLEIELFERKPPIKLEQLGPSTDSFQLRNFSQIFLNMLRTWAGLFACSASVDQRKPITSALRHDFFFLGYIGLNQATSSNIRKIRDLIIECCCELLELPYSRMRFTDWLHTMHYYSTLDHPDAFKCSLRNEFILSEHEMYYQQHMLVNDLLVSYRSVVVYLLINANLIQALSRIILQNPDDPVALRATLLMHDLLLVGSTCLPMEWRFRVQSLPSLVHSACETISDSHITKKCSLDDFDCKTDNFVFAYTDRRNVVILLNRLDILNNITLARKAQPAPISNLQLFVQSSPSARKIREPKLSEMNFCDSNFAIILEKLLFKAVDSDGRLCWPFVDKLLQFVQASQCFKNMPIKYGKACYKIFRMVFNFITPAKGMLIDFVDDRYVITCCCRAVHVSLLFATREAQYRELLVDFISDFISNISEDALLSGTLSSKNLMNTGAIYYFAFIGAMSSTEEGRQMLEATPLLHLFDLLPVMMNKKSASKLGILFQKSCEMDTQIVDKVSIQNQVIDVLKLVPVFDIYGLEKNPEVCSQKQ